MSLPAKKTLARLTLVLATLFLTTNPSFAAMIEFQDAPVVDRDHLDSMRGGFVTRDHGLISLGITKVINIDGILKVTNSLQIPDVARLTKTLRNGTSENGVFSYSSYEEATAPGMEQVAGPSADQLVVSRELGADALSGAKGMLVLNEGFSTLIQNNMNQKTIQNLTIVEATVASVRLIREINMMHRMNEQMISAMR
ncbi:MAG: hypothetical protein R2940_08285 [Syntrophotaleaceae bacterium]